MIDPTDRLPPAADAPICTEHFSPRRDAQSPPICEKAYAMGLFPCEFPVSPPRSSREETPKDSPVPLDVEAARALISEQEQWAIKSAEECDRLGVAGLPDRRLSYIAEANLWRHRAGIYRSLASSLSGIAELRRMAATFAAELGHVPDPRLRVESVPIERITRKTSTFQGIPRVLTNVEVDAILAALAARLASDSGTGDDNG